MCKYTVSILTIGARSRDKALDVYEKQISLAEQGVRLIQFKLYYYSFA
jgi:L-ribulose-5-phosphate 3-epimerase UlaE